MDVVQALINYLADVVAQGEYRSDWLTHLPTFTRDTVQMFGHVLAIILGS